MSPPTKEKVIIAVFKHAPSICKQKPNPFDLLDSLSCASQWMDCNGIFRFIIYHRWAILFQRDSWLAWMPRAVWWADVLEHELFLCFIFNSLLIHFSLFTPSPLCFICLALACRLPLPSFLFFGVFLTAYSDLKSICLPLLFFSFLSLLKDFFFLFIFLFLFEHILALLAKCKWVVEFNETILGTLGS